LGEVIGVKVIEKIENLNRFWVDKKE
jgi:hypothetical protein